MGKISLTELAAVLSKRYSLNKKDATLFVTQMFDVIQQSLEQDKLVKIKGLGTFKIIDVDDRESVNVNTGERVLIEGHQKITFTPDALMKELVNKPFSQFETVVLNDGVDFDEPVAAESLVSEPELEEEAPESEDHTAMPLVDFGELENDEKVTEEVVEEKAEVDDSEWVIEPVKPAEPAKKPEPATKPEAAPEPEPEPEPDPEPEPVLQIDPEPEPAPEPEPEPEPEPDPEPQEEPESEEPEEESYDDEEETSGGKKWWLVLLALLVGLAGGYVLGNYVPFSTFQHPKMEILVEEVPDSSIVETPAIVEPADSVELADSVVAEEPKVEEVKAEEPKAEEPKAKEPKVEAPKAQAPKAPAPKAEAPKAPAPKAQAPKAEAPKAQAPKAEAPKAETPKPVFRKAEVPAPGSRKTEASKAAEPEKKPATPQLDQWQKKDSRVRTGAWRIVGTAQVYKVKEGETLKLISRRFLGPDMDCYIEVYNNLTADSPLKAGQEIKIPQLKHKKAK